MYDDCLRSLIVATQKIIHDITDVIPERLPLLRLARKWRPLRSALSVELCRWQPVERHRPVFT
jgi:hypothetical protein